MQSSQCTICATIGELLGILVNWYETTKNQVQELSIVYCRQLGYIYDLPRHDFIYQRHLPKF